MKQEEHLLELILLQLLDQNNLFSCDRGMCSTECFSSFSCYVLRAFAAYIYLHCLLTCTGNIVINILTG